jgi:hypothetical protein
MLAITMALCISLAACSNEGIVSPTDDSGDGTSELVMRATEISALTVEMPVEDGSIASEIRERPSRPDTVNRPNPREPKRPFARLLDALKLDETQRASVAELLAQHKECVDAALASLRAAEREIIAAAEAARKDVLAQVQAGTLTRQEAIEQIRNINQRARTALKGLPQREGTRAAIKNCDETFYAGLETLLTPEQVVILKRWIASQNGGAGTSTGRR